MALSDLKPAQLNQLLAQLGIVDQLGQPPSVDGFTSSQMIPPGTKDEFGNFVPPGLADSVAYQQSPVVQQYNDLIKGQLTQSIQQSNPGMSPQQVKNSVDASIPSVYRVVQGNASQIKQQMTQAAKAAQTGTPAAYQNLVLKSLDIAAKTGYLDPSTYQSTYQTIAGMPPDPANLQKATDPSKLDTSYDMTALGNYQSGVVDPAVAAAKAAQNASAVKAQQDAANIAQQIAGQALEAQQTPTKFDMTKNVIQSSGSGFAVGGQTFQTLQQAQIAASTAGIPASTYNSQSGGAVQGTTAQTTGGIVPIQQTTGQANTLPGAATTATSNTTAQNSVPASQGPGGSPQSNAAAMDVLNGYLNDGTIDSGTYQFFKQAIADWTPGTATDYANILNSFEQIKNSEINPEFQEQAKSYIASVNQDLKTLGAQNQIDTQNDASIFKQNIENDQQKLANSGMLFTGQAVKELGNQSPFAQSGSAQGATSAIPTVDFGGLPIGTIQQSNQAATSSTALRYQDSLAKLSQQAENTLGTTGSAGLVPGITQIGGITGSQTQAKQQAEGDVLTNLYNQDQQNTAAKQPITNIDSSKTP